MGSTSKVQLIVIIKAAFQEIKLLRKVKREEGGKRHLS